MKSLRHHKLSTYLFLLSLVLLTLGSIMAYFVHRTVNNLTYDAKIINQTGIIRGSIQRYSKLVLSNSGQASEEISRNINVLLERFLSGEEGYSLRGPDKFFSPRIHDLDQKWKRLYDKLLEYRVSPSPGLRKTLIAESEQCWNAADAVVLTAQLVNEAKVGNMRLFYIILALNGISTMLVMFLAFSYVRKKLEIESSRDPLTNLFNRRSYKREITAEMARSSRYNRPMSLILLDIDFFKTLNDNHGHDTGDKVLVMLAKIITDSTRGTDSVFRLGGEEFAIITTETSAMEAFQVAEKVRHRVEEHIFTPDQKLSVSLGIAEINHEDSVYDLYHRADQALYSAKRKGRNQTVVSSVEKKKILSLYETAI